jgi:ankyrin repeat protein
MKHFLLTTIAAVLVVGCGESQQSAPLAEAKPAEPVAEAAQPEPPTAKAPAISLHLAAQNGNHEAVKQLFEDGVDINMRDTMGLTPLDYAYLGVLEHGITVRDFILENGGKTGDWFRVDESIQIAVEVGNVEAVKKHLDAGAEVNGKDKLFGHTLLHQAASGGNTEIVEMLLTAGADVNATEGIQGGTPLHSASTKEVAGLLIAQGADVNIKNTFF